MEGLSSSLSRDVACAFPAPLPSEGAASSTLHSLASVTVSPAPKWHCPLTNTNTFFQSLNESCVPEKENLEFKPRCEIGCLVCGDKRLEMAGNWRVSQSSPKALPSASAPLSSRSCGNTLDVPGLPAQITAVRISGCYHIMRLNERFLTPTCNYSLEKDLLMELNVTRDQLEERYVIRFSSVCIALREEANSFIQQIFIKGPL